jgi:magnesium-transporting ATPase (P-type)
MNHPRCLQVWVLTGDKVETAISIAFSARLFSDTMAIVELRDRDLDRALAAAGVARSERSIGPGGGPAPPAAGSMEQIVEVEQGVSEPEIERALNRWVISLGKRVQERFAERVDAEARKVFTDIVMEQFR